MGVTRPFYVTARANTPPMPHPAGVFDIDVDLVDHAVAVRTAHGVVERTRVEAPQRRRLLPSS